MFKLNIFIIILLLEFNKVFPKKVECPSHCKCDVFQKYRRATCINQSLVSVEADIPVEVELLDLSYNLVRELHDHIFVDLSFTSLKLLNLSHNKISQIHMNAFSDMNNIKTIDLSFNNIEYLLENWFWNIPALEELYLQGNNLMKLREGPILESKSLRVLNLSTCSLPHIHEDAFSKLPNLEILDLSKNSLIQLNVNAIKHLPNLKKLKLENNTWHCNDVITNLTNYCKNKEIHCSDICTKPPPVIVEEKFQRMVEEPKITTAEPQNSWIYDDEDEKNRTIIQACSNATNTPIKKDVLMEIIEINPILAVVSPFIAGLTLGLIISCGVAGRTAKPKSRKKKRVSRRPSIVRTRRNDDMYDYPLVQAESFEVCDSTPIPLRKDIFRANAVSDSFI